MPFLKPLAAWRRDETGTAAIEFAAIASFLVILLVGVTDVSRLALSSMRVRYAAEAGATYAVMKGSDTANDPAILAAAAAATSLSDATTTSSIYYGCAAATGVIVVGSANANCNTSATGTSISAGKYIAVTTQVEFQPYFQPVFLVYPQTISHKLEVRVK
jgi:Flp pilus assembly protein TadG